MLEADPSEREGSGKPGGAGDRVQRGEPRLERLRWFVVGGVLLLTLSGCRLRHKEDKSSAPGRSPALRSLGVAAKVSKEPDVSPRAPRQAPAPTPRRGADTIPTPPAGGTAIPTEVLPAAENERTPAPDGWKVFAYAGGVDFPKAVEEQSRLLLGEATAVEAAARIVSLLEDREDTNAGRGAGLRMDGETIECAASVQDDVGRAGRVGGLRSSWNPSSVALALYRAGGGSMWGPAGDELSERLGLRVGSLKTGLSERSYELDLARAVQSKTTNEFLLPLYVGGEVLAKALKTDPKAFASRPLRDPVFVLVITPEGRSALAWSTGGAPVSPPGQPSPLLREASAPALQGRRAAVLLSGEATCPTSPHSLVESLQGAFSLQFPVATLESTCPATRYFVRGDTETRTNLPAASMLMIDGTMEQKAVREAQSSRSLAPSEGLSEAPAKKPTLPAQRPTEERPAPAPPPDRASPPLRPDPSPAAKPAPARSPAPGSPSTPAPSSSSTEAKAHP